MPEKTILVLGCGMAGVVACRELRRLLPEERIVVIDRAARASYPPSHAAVAVGELRSRAILRPRTRLARHGIEFVNAEVHQIDVERGHVRAESRELRYDYLILALGAQAAPELVPGLADSTQGFYSFEAAERLTASLRYFAGGRVLITVPAGPIKWQPAPYELAMLLEHSFHERKMRQRVEIVLCTPEHEPLAGLSPAASEMIAGQMAHKGIELRSGWLLESVEPGRHVAHFQGGDDLAFDLLIAVPPQVAPAPVVAAGLVNQAGWVSADPVTLRTAAEGVFAAGDLVATATEGEPAGQSGELARQQGLAAARQVASQVLGLVAAKEPSGRTRWFVEVGAGAAAMIAGDFLKEPTRVRASEPSIIWHWAKAVREKLWLYRRY